MGVILKSIQQKSFLIATTKHQKKTILGQQVRGKNYLVFSAEKNDIWKTLCHFFSKEVAQKSV